MSEPNLFPLTYVFTMNRFLFFKRTLVNRNTFKPKVCIIGSGPTGFYAAQHLIKKLPDVSIDIYERFPVPFGLVRYGVAPDHPEVKNVINTFSKTAEKSNVRFIGNVNLGQNVSLKQLRKAYHVVLLSYGADENRSLNIPGEDLKNVLPARNIVGWYNGIPWDSNLNIDLSGENVTIFGQGNVAIDVARILLSPIDKLKQTDITEYSLEKLSKSKVKEIKLIGRRGPLQAAFTIKELREILNLNSCSISWCYQDFNGVTECVSGLPRPKKRITELMLSSLKETPSKCIDRSFKPIFHRSPLEFKGTDRILKVILSINKLEGDDLLNKKAIKTEKIEEIDCNLAVTSIGYKSIQADKDIPFDNDRGIVKNINGKVDKGLYVSGWLATGPTGVILTTMSNAFAVAGDIFRDIEIDNLLNEDKGGYEEISKILQQNNIQTVSWKDWLKIDEFEKEAGKKLGKPREKIVDIRKMLEIAS